MVHFTLPQTASSQITVTSTATKITKLIDPNVEANNSIPSDLDAIDIYVESGSARYLVNGTPTTTEGLALDAGKTYFLRGVFLKDFNVISGDSAVLTISIGKTEYGEQSSIPSSSGGGAWGEITGTLSEQTDLQGALDAKEDDYTGTWTSPVTIPAPTLGSELVANGGFETWSEGNPSDWTKAESEGQTGGAVAEETTIIHGGTKSLKITVGSVGIIGEGQVISSLTAEDYTFSAWGYNSGADANCVILNGAVGAATEYFDPSDLTWKLTEGGGIPNWDFVIGGTEDTWEQKTFVMPPPDSGEITVLVYANGSETDIAYFDDISLKANVYPPISIFTEASALDADDLHETQVIFTRGLTGGSSLVVDQITKDGERKTDFPTFDFSDKGIKTIVANGTIAGEQPTPTEVETALGVTADEVGDGFIAVMGKTSTDDTIVVVTRNGKWFAMSTTLLTEGA